MTTFISNKDIALVIFNPGNPIPQIKELKSSQFSGHHKDVSNRIKKGEAHFMDRDSSLSLPFTVYDYAFDLIDGPIYEMSFRGGKILYSNVPDGENSLNIIGERYITEKYVGFATLKKQEVKVFYPTAILKGPVIITSTSSTFINYGENRHGEPNVTSTKTFLTLEEAELIKSMVEYNDNLDLPQLNISKIFKSGIGVVKSEDRTKGRAR